MGHQCVVLIEYLSMLNGDYESSQFVIYSQFICIVIHPSTQLFESVIVQ